MDLIDREDHQKLYLQLYEILKKKIETNEWTVGSQIPTEDDLCKIFNVSRATVRTAVLDLVRQGYLKRQQGKGTFIYRNIISEGLNMQTSFKELLLEEGLEVTPKVLARTVMMPVDNLEQQLEITPDKHIIYIKRLWSVQDEPVLLQENYIPYHICPLLLEDDIEHNSLFELLEKKYRIKITRIRNQIDIIRLTTDDERVLILPEGSMALLMTQKFYSGDTLIMYARKVKKPSRYQFLVELERKVV